MLLNCKKKQNPDNWNPNIPDRKEGFFPPDPLRRTQEAGRPLLHLSASSALHSFYCVFISTFSRCSQTICANKDWSGSSNSSLRTLPSSTLWIFEDPLWGSKDNMITCRRWWTHHSADVPGWREVSNNTRQTAHQKGKMWLSRLFSLNGWKGLSVSSDYCWDFWPMKTQPDVSAWFFLAGLILLLRPEIWDPHWRERFFQTHSGPLKKSASGPAGFHWKRKASKNAESPRGIIPTESWCEESRTGRMFCSDRSANTLLLLLWD